MKAGFLTPASLHYVRNHGAVPKCEWSTHRLSIDGLVESPTSFSMDDLLAMPAREIPVTLCCAGNRRKEENLVKQTIGFNWGAAGVSTSVWKGVPLRDVLLKCGVKTPKDGANHVCFVGAETMPKGRYGTSINWFTAMDPSCDVMLAYEQNGERLNPDHGYPLRLVIPGYIGGRMIKWLTEISVTTKESDNHFHYMDNRVLPEFVDAERATAEGWWYKPDYIINELNINSAIANPGEPTPGPATRRATPRHAAHLRRAPAPRTAPHATPPSGKPCHLPPPPTAAHRAAAPPRCRPQGKPTSSPPGHPSLTSALPSAQPTRRSCS